MAKRHDALLPLTHDHHHALAQCRRLNRAAESDQRSVRIEQAEAFLDFFLGRALHHFREEEELFFPPAAAISETSDLVVRAVMEHLKIHGLVADLKRQLRQSDLAPELMREISETLRSHVRFEEGELFPLIERLVPSDSLNELATHRREV